MLGYKNKALSAALGCSLLLSGAPYVQAADAQSPKKGSCLEKIIETKELPHFMRDLHVTTIKDDVDKVIEKYRLYHATAGMYGDSEASPTFENGCIRFTQKICGKDVEFLLPEYQEKDGKILYITKLGRKEISAEELDKVKQYLVRRLGEAVEFIYNDHKEYTANIIAGHEENLKKKGKLKPNEKLADMLDKVIPGWEADPKDPLDRPITIKDALMIPVVTKESFVPTQLYLSPINAFGICYLNTGRVLYHPLAAAVDEIDGLPITLAHELVHKNPELQSLPFTGYWDCELFASFPMLNTEDAMTYFTHPYFEKFRYLGKVIYGFDSEKAFSEALMPVTGSTIEFDRKKLEWAVKNIKALSADMRKIAYSKVGPEFYKNFFYWAAVGKEVDDDQAVFEILTYAYREPCLLNGLAETKTWLDEYALVIEDCARRAEQTIKNEKTNDNSNAMIILQRLNREQREAVSRIGESFGFKKNASAEEIYREIDSLKRLGVISDANWEHFLKQIEQKIPAMRW